MANHIKVKFGTTEEEIQRLILKLTEVNHWDPSRVRYVVDLNACTVADTVYAVSNTTADLPLHPNGPEAVQKLI
ncbi:MAG: hypothetical protein O7G87_03325 [bacterium]|nr:hypothetical protein [bacterium]